METIIEDRKIINKEIKRATTIRSFSILIKKIFMITVVIYIIFTYFFGLHRAKDSSMSPSISQGELSIYYRLQKKYGINDVIIFSMNNRKYVSRIIATAGQVVDIDEDGYVTVDGHPENYTALYQTALPDGSKIEFPYRVKLNSVFVLQDYRTEAQDSRIFGSIEVNKIEGKVISTLKVRDI